MLRRQIKKEWYKFRKIWTEAKIWYCKRFYSFNRRNFHFSTPILREWHKFLYFWSHLVKFWKNVHFGNQFPPPSKERESKIQMLGFFMIFISSKAARCSEFQYNIDFITVSIWLFQIEIKSDYLYFKVESIKKLMDCHNSLDKVTYLGSLNNGLYLQKWIRVLKKYRKQEKYEQLYCFEFFPFFAFSKDQLIDCFNFWTPGLPEGVLSNHLLGPSVRVSVRVSVRL